MPTVRSPNATRDNPEWCSEHPPVNAIDLGVGREAEACRVCVTIQQEYSSRRLLCYTTSKRAQQLYNSRKDARGAGCGDKSAPLEKTCGVHDSLEAVVLLPIVAYNEALITCTLREVTTYSCGGRGGES